MATSIVTVGHGFRVHHDFKGIYTGDEGIIIAPGLQNNYVHVNILRRGAGAPNKNAAEAWIPKDFLHCSTVRYGDITVDPRLPTVNQERPQGANVAAINPANVLEQTILGLLLAIKSNLDSDILEGVDKGAFAPMLEGNKLAQTFHTIIAGIKKAGVYDILSTPNFTAEQLRNAGKRIHKASTEEAWRGGGVYGFAVNDTTAAPDRRIQLYTGKAGDFSTRYEGHVDNRLSGKQEIYRAMRASTSWKCFALCWLDEDIDTIRALTEQLFLLLLRTYHPRMLVWLDKDVRETQPAGTSLDEQTQRKYFHLEDATLFINIAKSVFSKTGWTAGCGMAGFGSKTGLNISSPLTEPQGGHDKPVWIKTEIPGVIATYTRRPTLVQKSTQVDAKPISSVPTYSKFYLPKKGPATGAIVTITIEIMLNGQQHRFSFARIPFIGPYADWKLACGLAIRADWVDELGNECSMYLQQPSQFPQALEWMSGSEVGSLRGYSKAIQIVRYLNQEKLHSTLDWQQQDFLGLARIRHITFDVLQQRVQIAGVTTSRLINPPRLLSRDELATLMRSAGAQQVGQSIGQFNSADTTPQSHHKLVDGTWQITTVMVPRIMCDACQRNEEVLDNQYNVPLPDCGKGNMGWCDYCDKLGRPCSFTATPTLHQNDMLKRAVGPPETWQV
ncbi:hypothetical protein LTR56_018093 [Elasticomyces elasticus]|nr:hypothetical protein LTR56_018093 [Elasticomyces elasticus]KAK3642507.1 hypothetical protein LTR22_016042 [Elasticomyces elasticus]KAK4908852.1 hypothetical protein LTR49_022290 [Elasticomyces elasticus]